MLQVVQAVATHTVRRSSSLKDFELVFRGRVSALARAHELVSAGKWTDVSLQDLLTKELGPYAQGEGQLVLDGLPLRLRPRAALALGMVLHELATNAAKYGALSVPQGRLTIRWEKEEEAQDAAHLILRWTEKGGPPVIGTPERRGFGSELIERQLHHDLKGTLDTAFETAGLRVTLSLPLEVVAQPRKLPGGVAAEDGASSRSLRPGP
jgi:two-component system CheB/CheR fusion protein